MKRISVDEAKARFSAMVDGVLHQGERYVIEQDGQEVAALVSVPELRRIEAASTRDVRPGGPMALVGLWGDVSDEEIDALVADLRRARDGDTGRRVELPDLR